MTKRYMFAIVLISMVTAGWLLAADTWYVQSASARLMAEPGFNAAVKAELERGAALTVMETRGRWYRVEYRGTQGWMNRLLLARTAPADRVSILAEQPLLEDGRRRASATVSTAAARGLRAEERARISDGDSVDYQSLGEVEALDIDDQEVRDFMDARQQ